MMLLTWTWEPPTCDAMLPQKFSAATTWILPVPKSTCEVPTPHAANTTARATIETILLMRAF